MDIEQWGFFSVPHLLWHEANIYIGHLWDPVPLTPVAERFAVELSLYIPFLRLRSVAAGIWTLKHNYFTNKLLQVDINKLNFHICIAYIRIRHLIVCSPPYGLCTKYLIEFSNSFPDKFNWLLVHSETWSSSTWWNIISFLMARFFSISSILKTGSLNLYILRVLKNNLFINNFGVKDSSRIITLSHCSVVSWRKFLYLRKSINSS